MIPFLSPRIVTLLLVLAGIQAPMIRPGEPLEGVLGSGESRTFIFAPVADGKITVSLESFDFDALLRVTAASGSARTRSDDNGGIATNARLAMEVRAENSYRISVSSASPEGAGEFVLTLSEGDPPRPSQSELARELTRYHNRAAKRAGERGDAKSAARNSIDEATAWFNQGNYARADKVMKSALTFSRESGDPALMGEALNATGAILQERGDSATALEYFMKGLEQYRAANHTFGELRVLLNLGLCHDYLGNGDESLRWNEKACAHAREAGDQLVETRALINIGRVLMKREDGENAKKRFDEAIALARKAKDRGSEAWALFNLGLLCNARRDWTRGREIWQQRLDLSMEMGHRAIEAWSRWGLAILHVGIGDFGQARSGLESAFDLATRFGVGNLLGTVRHDLAVVYVEQGLLDKAESMFKAVLVDARARNDRGGEARVLSNLGDLEMRRRAFARAREHAVESLRIRKESGNPEDRLASLTQLALVEGELGNSGAAHSLLQEASALAGVPADPEAAREIAVAYAVMEHWISNYPACRAAYAKSLDLAREIGDGRSEVLARLGLAEVEWHLGEIDLALEHAMAGNALARRLGLRVLETELLRSQGRILRSRGDISEAREIFEEVIAIAEERGDRTAASSARLSLAITCIEQKEWELAVGLLEGRAARGSKTNDIVMRADALGTMSVALLGAGRVDRAEEAARESLSLLERFSDSTLQMHALLVLSRLAIVRGNPDAAGDWIRRAFGLVNALDIGGMEIDEVSKFRSIFADWGRIAQDWTALRIRKQASSSEERKRAVEEGFRLAGRWKGPALLEGIVEHFQGGRSAESIELTREYREIVARRNAAMRRVSEALREGHRGSEIEKLRAEATALRSGSEKLEETLRERFPREVGLVASCDVGPKEVATRVLDEGTALIEFVEGEADLHAYVLHRGRLRFLTLGTLRDAEAEVDAYVSLLADPYRGTRARVADSGQALYRRLLAPALNSAGEGVRRLVVVPSSVVASLPIEALVIGEQTDGRKARGFAGLEYVLDRYKVSYSPSTPVLVELGKLGPREARGRVLVMADPWYPSELADASGKGTARPGRYRRVPKPTDLDRLWSTREEGLALARLLIGAEQQERQGELLRLADQRHGSLTTSVLDLHLGRQAGRSKITTDLTSFGIIHFACHGYVDREDPRRTGLALAADGSDGGFLTVADVLDLDLDADMVVLSACESATGTMRAGEGLQSLARAFLYAGARSVVASLWKVSDSVAAETMQAFYREFLAQGRIPSRALHDAKLAIRRSSRVRGIRVPGGAKAASDVDSGHPHYWAPFIFVGAPR